VVVDAEGNETNKTTPGSERRSLFRKGFDRADIVRDVRYQDACGRFCELHAGDDRNLSELLQHEIDHLDGILAVDRITDIRTLCTREEFERRYRAQSPYAVEATA